MSLKTKNMISKKNLIKYLFFITLFITFQSLSCKDDKPNSQSDNTIDTSIEPPIPAPTTIMPNDLILEGQKIIFDFWEIENELVPLKGGGVKDYAKRDELKRKLNAISIANYQYYPMQHRSLLTYRKKILECADKSGFDYGYCTGEMMFFLNSALADFGLDIETSKQLGNFNFTQRVTNQAGFMKSMTLPQNKKPLPKASAMVFGELCLLSVAIFNAQAPDYFDNKQAQMSRTALFAVDISKGSVNEREILNNLYNNLIDWSMSYGKDGWEAKRSEVAFFLIKGLSQLNISNSDFIDTKYEDVQQVVVLMEQLIR